MNVKILACSFLSFVFNIITTTTIIINLYHDAIFAICDTTAFYVFITTLSACRSCEKFRQQQTWLHDVALCHVFHTHRHNIHPSIHLNKVREIAKRTCTHTHTHTYVDTCVHSHHFLIAINICPCRQTDGHFMIKLCLYLSTSTLSVCAAL